VGFLGFDIMLDKILLLPFFLQACVMFFDEFYYHRKRGLPKWEIWGHPLDTLSVLCCFYFLTHNEANRENLYIYISLSSLSCLFVTKDEWVHSKLCCTGEMWLHSMLFILHPLLLTAAGVLWFYKDIFEGSQTFLLVQPYIITAFMLYQILYWGLPWKKFVTLITRSTTP
jgi:hypothetical protein